MRSAYYIFNACVLLPVLLLSLLADVKPQRHPKRLVAGFVLVSLPFILWDFWAANAGHWDFNKSYVYGPWLFSVPLEEILFFITVPLACIYVWGVICKYSNSVRKISNQNLRAAFFLATLMSTLLLILYWQNGYTRSAIISFLVMLLLLLWRRDIANLPQFWAYQLATLALFLLANGMLTALPIITYGEGAIIGFKIGTIPIEDFIFNFALLNSWLVIYGKKLTI